MKKIEVYLKQNRKTYELEVELRILEDATANDIDEIWELVERARVIIKQINNYGFKITETQE